MYGSASIAAITPHFEEGGVSPRFRGVRSEDCQLYHPLGKTGSPLVLAHLFQVETRLTQLE
jgi:hypothetical protein